MSQHFKRRGAIVSTRRQRRQELCRHGLQLLSEARLPEAKQIAAEVLELDEKFAQGWSLLGEVLSMEGAVAEAELALRRALELDDSLEAASLAFGRVLMKQRKFQEAAVHAASAVKRFPKSAGHWLVLAGTLASLKEGTRAEFCYRKSLEIDPANSQAHLELANILWRMSREGEAKREFELAQTNGSALLSLRNAQLFTPLPNSEEQITFERDHFARELDRLFASTEPVANPPEGSIATNFFLAYHGLDDRALQEKWTRLLLKACPSLDLVPRRPPRHRTPTDRKRVGFISAFLKDGHTISRLNIGLMQKLPRDRFEVTAFDVSASAESGYLPLFAEKVVQCSSQSAVAIRQLADANLDVAFYPDIGMHSGTYRMAFSRVAPVQCTSWGHPVTTGLKSIDYFISSDLIEPEAADAHYTEKLVRLPTLPAYYMRPTRLTTRRPSFPEDWHVYFSPQSLFKFHPRFDAVLADILRRDPAGRLVLIDMEGEYANKLMDRIGARHPDIVDRIVFLPRMPLDELFGIMQTCHAMLDTNPFGGGNTNYEAFAFGTPVVTMPGDFMRGRVTLGCYRRMQFEECVATSAEEYVARALRLGNDRDYREWVRAEILSRSSALYEDQTAVDEFAAFFERACDCSSTPNKIADELPIHPANLSAKLASGCDPVKAEQQIRKVLKTCPAEVAKPDWWTVLALALARQNRLVQAEEVCRHALSIDTADDRAAHLLTHVLGARDQVRASEYWRHFQTGRITYRTYPRNIAIETVGRCNASCTFCPHPHLDRRHSSMSDELFNKIVDDLRQIPHDHPFVIFPNLVDEPFMDRKIFVRCSTINDLLPQASFVFFSNLSFLPPHFFDRLGALRNVLGWNISFNAAEPDEYKRTMGLPFDRTVSNLKALLTFRREKNLVNRPVVVSRVQDGTERDLSFIDRCKSLFSDFQYGKDFVAVCKPRTDWLGRVNTPISSVPHGLPCGGWLDLNITCDGRVPHCCMDAHCDYPIGDVRTDSVLDIYNNPAFRRLREIHSAREGLDPCGRCPLLQ